MDQTKKMVATVDTKKRIDRVMAELGYYRSPSGGGAEWYEKVVSPAITLTITDTHGVDAPESLDDDILLYANDHDGANHPIISGGAKTLYDYLVDEGKASPNLDFLKIGEQDSPFELVDTGGGFTAYRAELSKRTGEHILITNDDGDLPIVSGFPVIVGLYNADADYIGDITFDTLEEALPFIKALTYFYHLYR